MGYQNPISATLNVAALRCSVYRHSAAVAARAESQHGLAWAQRTRFEFNRRGGARPTRIMRLK
eukprot:3315053-Pleurochrysis_carterae.AAC.1